MGKWLLWILLFLLGFSQFTVGQFNNNSSGNKAQKIHADLIVLKLKTPLSSAGRLAISPQEQLDELKKQLNYEEHHQVFPTQSISNARISGSRLHNIYKLRFKSGTNIWRELSKIKKLDYVEYAEPFFQNELMLIPNDPQADPDGGLQDYLSVIKAYDGWQIDQSDSSMVIGIIDTGVNMNHEDLGNIAFNYNDPINGVDDDNDGFIDNYHGWDIGNNDNDPTADDYPHGTHVTGISSATTNNSIGMAGIGFYSRYLPVNAWNSTYKILLNEYEGIVYAADHGAKVINLSWGSANIYSRYGQDIINYAVLEKNVVIVAAAGNTHADLDFYPASYDNVLSVGATDMEDNMATWATYSHFIDIMAPGQKIYSTKNNGTYEKSGGSSFATPMVAGAAALVRSHFPAFSAQQVMEQLRVTSDDIYAIGSNMDYFGQMGRGRLNVHHALSDILTPSIRLSEFQYESNHGDLVFPGDSVKLTFKFTNYLRIAENVTVTITNPSENVSWEVDQIYIDELLENQSYENTDDPIFLTVNTNVEPGERLLFRIDYVGNNYTDFQYIQIKTTPEYFNVSDGNLAATISSDGDIGYDESFYINGDGVAFKEVNIASNTGLIISLDSMHVLDNIINDFEFYTRDEDFVAEKNVRLFDNSIADYDARSSFKPYDTLASALDIKVEQKVLSWENATNDGYLIFEYRIVNAGDSTLNGFNAALYADWDLGEYQANEAAWDATDNFGYVFDKSGGNLYSGLALLTNQTTTHYAIDIGVLNGNSADIDTIFDDKLKHNFLSQSSKDTAGSLGAGNDVAHIVGGKDMTILPNQSLKVAIAMLSSNSLEGLRSALNLARSSYNDYLENPPLYESFFACDGTSALVDPVGEIYEFYSDLETTQRIDSGYSFTTEPVFSDQEYFLINLDSGYVSDVMKILVKPGNPTADFVLAMDTLLIESGQSGALSIGNTSSLSDQWHWDFGNGYSSIVEYPETVYDTPGLFNVELIASNNYGCSDTTTKELLVAIRLDRAVVEDQEICKGTNTSISASNTNMIKVYSDQGLTNMLYSGEAYETSGIFTDSIFYVVNADGDFNSVASEANILVKYPQIGFDFQVDTTNLNEKYVLYIYNSNGPIDNIEWQVDNQLIGVGTDVNYVYSSQPFEISQIKQDEEGCTDTLRMTISPQYSNQPILDDVIICKNSSYSIEPPSGTMFYFYDDLQLTNLLHKGHSWKIDDLSEDSEFFITNVDGLLESASASIKLLMDPVTARIGVSSDTIDFSETNQVELYNNSMDVSDSYWLLPTGTFDTTTMITAYYDQPGTYEYTLVAEGNTRCFDTAFQKIHIVHITGFTENLSSKLNVYPNPVSDFLNISIEDVNQEIEFELVDVTGKRLQTIVVNSEKANHQLDLTSFKKGIYFIRSLKAEFPFISKILKQ